MYDYLAFGYEFLSEFIPFLIAFVIFQRVQKKTGSIYQGHYVICAAVFIYVFAVFYVTNVGTIYDLMTAQVDEMIERINLIPFSRSIHTIGYILNIVMFVPFGFGVPLICKDMRNLPRLLFSAASFSLLIEVTQLFSYRGSDVDDLVINTLGAFVGYFIYTLWNKFTKSKSQVFHMRNMELFTYILVMFLGRFFLFDRVGLINLIYGN